MSFGGGGSGSSSIAGSTDVVLSSPTSKQVLSYDSTAVKWKNDDPAMSFNPRGEWAPSTSYDINDIITSAGQTFRVTAPHTTGTGQPSPTGPWSSLELWAAKGADGSGGSGSVSYETLPVGTNVSVDYSGSSYPARPTSRTDIIVIWRGPTQPPAMLDGDEWKVTS